MIPENKENYNCLNDCTFCEEVKQDKLGEFKGTCINPKSIRFALSVGSTDRCDRIDVMVASSGTIKMYIEEEIECSDREKRAISAVFIVVGVVVIATFLFIAYN